MRKPARLDFARAWGGSGVQVTTEPRYVVHFGFLQLRGRDVGYGRSSLLSQARSATALRRAFVARVNSSLVFVSTGVDGRPGRRVWWRTGNPAVSIRVCTCW